MTAPYAIATSVGQVRENNEDFAMVVEDRDLFLIADGMGGHLGGEIASRVAVETVASILSEQSKPRKAMEEQTLLAEAVMSANGAVLREATARDLPGMGTTLTCAVLRGRSLTIAHIGDTRAYLVADGRADQITTDHTLVAMMVESGEVDEGDARTHPERHLLTQALGTQDLVKPDVVQTRVPKGARLLLSTDGLHDIVDHESVVELALQGDPRAAADALVAAANDAGGPDNITVILVDL